MLRVRRVLVIGSGGAGKLKVAREIAMATVLALLIAGCLVWGFGGRGEAAASLRSRSSHSPVSVPRVNRAAFARYGNLAFISEGSLWVLDGRTGRLRLVAAATRQPLDPEFSPDGSWLSYSVGSGRVWLARADGSSPQPVAGGGGGGWFPGGKIRAGTHLWRVSARGAITRVATVPKGLVAWSPDGGRYAFVSDSLNFTKAATWSAPGLVDI